MPSIYVKARGGPTSPTSCKKHTHTPSDSQTRMPMEGFDGAAALCGFTRRKPRGTGDGAPRWPSRSFHRRVDERISYLRCRRRCCLLLSAAASRSPGSRSSFSQCRYRPRRGAGERYVLLTCNLSAAGTHKHAHSRDGNSSSFQRTASIDSAHEK